MRTEAIAENSLVEGGLREKLNTGRKPVFILNRCRMKQGEINSCALAQPLP
jgi:hypothetical protein